MRRLLVPSLSCLAVACGSGAPARSSLAAAVDTVDGVVRLSYGAAPADTLPWHFDTLAVIGGATVEDEHYQFQQVTADRLAGDAQGNLFVVDGQGKRILRYDANGKFVASYGREGGGPGELRFPISVTLGPGDSLWVPDMMNRRITIYDTAGAGSRSIDATNAQGMSGSTVGVAAGHYYQTTRAVVRGTFGGESPPTFLVRFTPDGTALDTVWRQRPVPTNTVTLEAGNTRMVMLMPQVFAPRFAWAVLSDGRTVVSDSADYVLRVVAPDGTIERLIRREPPARPTTDEDRDAERQRVLGQTTSGSPINQEEFRRQRVANMTFAATIPRVTRLLVDPRDRIWVGVSVEKPNATERIDVYDASGRLLGEIRDPAFFPDLVYGPGLAARITADEFDVQQIVVMKLVE